MRAKFALNRQESVPCAPCVPLQESLMDSKLCDTYRRFLLRRLKAK